MLYAVLYMLWLIVSTVCFGLVVFGDVSKNKGKRYITYLCAATNPISWIIALAISIGYVLSD